MKFLRHVGKHGDRKVAVVFREVPEEPHMCLVIYTELLNRNLHDSIMAVIEGDVAQSSENLYEALHRSYTREGKRILEVLHHEKFLKKIQTDAVTMTPIPNQSIRLNELNKLLNEMRQGEEAVKRMAELDKSHGLQHPADVARRMRNDTKSPPPSMAASASGALTDQQIAVNLRTQAEKMIMESEQLKVEAGRLQKEALRYDAESQAKLQPDLVTEGGEPVKVGAKRGRKPKAKTV